MDNKKFSELKNELITEGVRINGFGSWLYVRVDCHRLGLDSIYTDKMSLWVTASHEKKWEKAYQRLKNEGIDIKAFAEWLIYPRPWPKPEPRKDPFTLWGEAITKFGRALMSWLN